MRPFAKILWTLVVIITQCERCCRDELSLLIARACISVRGLVHVSSCVFSAHLLQEAETLPWSAAEIDVNGNDRPNSRSPAEASHSTDNENRLKLLEMSLRNAMFMVSK